MKNNSRYFIDKKSTCGNAAVVCMILAIVFRIIGILPIMKDTEGTEFFVLFALPVLSCALFILCILLLGRKAFWLSVVPLVIGVLFFILRIWTTDNITSSELSNIHKILCILLYLLIAVVYSCTIFGAIKTKWIMAPIFALAFVYHAVIEDYPAISSGNVTVSSVMMELSVLSIILALFFTSIGLRKKITADPESGKTVAPPIPGGGAVSSGKKDEPSNTIPAEENSRTSDASQTDETTDGEWVEMKEASAAQTEEWTEKEQEKDSLEKESEKAAEADEVKNSGEKADSSETENEAGIEETAETETDAETKEEKEPVRRPAILSFADKIKFRGNDRND